MSIELALTNWASLTCRPTLQACLRRSTPFEYSNNIVLFKKNVSKISLNLLGKIIK